MGIFYFETMSKKTFYDQATGRIVSSCYGNIELLDLSEFSQYPCIDDFGNPESQYVVDGQIVARPNCPATYQNGWILNVPCDGQILFDKNSYPIKAGNTEIAMPSNITTLVVDCFPYLTKALEIK